MENLIFLAFCTSRRYQRLDSFFPHFWSVCQVAVFFISLFFIRICHVCLVLGGVFNFECCMLRVDCNPMSYSGSVNCTSTHRL